MAERRKPSKPAKPSKPKKRSAQAREPRPLTLLDLPPALDPTGDLPTNPRLVVRPQRATTLPPPSAEALEYASLANLALAIRRTSPPPIEEPVVTVDRAARTLPAPPPSMSPAPASSIRRPRSASSAAPAPAPASARSSAPAPATLSQVPAPHVVSAQRASVEPHVAPTHRASVEPPAPAHAAALSSRPHYQRFSSAPPPVQIPSEPPRRRGGSGRLWLRTLGVIVLSATVGALVSSVTWGVKSELAKAAREMEKSGDERGSSAAAAPACTTAESPAETNASAAPATSALAATSTVTPPRVAFDALPLERAERRTGAERVSLDEAPGRAASGTATAHASHRRDANAEAPARTKRTPPPERTLPTRPSNAALSRAMARAAAAASSCDGGPHDGKVSVTFTPTGSVGAVTLVKGFGDAAVNSCVLRAFGRARVPAFSGEPIQVRKSVVW